MTGYSLGEQLTDAHGRIVDLEAELRCTEGDLAVAVAEAQRARREVEVQRQLKRDAMELGYTAVAAVERAREFVESVWGRAEQAAEQVRRIPAAGVAQAFADLADILGSDRDGDG